MSKTIDPDILRMDQEDMADEIMRLRTLINTPMVDAFLEAVRLEAAHQKKRWGDPHDRSKSAENWYWLIGYLAGKALRATIEGNRDKALHHTISSAAALMNWHEAIAKDATGRGLGEDADLEPRQPLYELRVDGDGELWIYLRGKTKQAGVNLTALEMGPIVGGSIREVAEILKNSSDGN